MLARDLFGKERRPELTIIMPMAFGKSAVDDVLRRGSGRHFQGGHNEKASLPLVNCLLSKPNQKQKMRLLNESLGPRS